MAQKEEDRMPAAREDETKQSMPQKRQTDVAEGSQDEDSDPSERLSNADEESASDDASSSEVEDAAPKASNGKGKDENAQKRKQSAEATKPKKKRKISGKEGANEDSDSEPEIVKGLSGDEVDTKNIVTGGRGARRGRATQAAHQMAKYKQKAQDSDEDSW